MKLEEALARTESAADATLRAAAPVVSSLRKFRSAAKTGNLRELRKAIDGAEQAISALKQQFVNAAESWAFEEEAYLTGGTFTSEILDTANQMGLKVFEQDDRLYCYPFLLRVMANERSVLIDKVRERRLRPTVLVKYLKELQNRPIRHNPQAFLESLYSAYVTAVASRGKGLVPGTVVPLLKIYELLTLLPGQSKEYTRQEFGRDIYLLDQSRVTTTAKGQVISFPASTGTRSTGATITVVTQSGQQKKYYGISFVPA